MPRSSVSLPGDGNTFELRAYVPSVSLFLPTANSEVKENGVSAAIDEDAEPVDHLSGSGTTLVRVLSLVLRPGMHLMITGWVKPLSRTSW